MVLVLVVVVIVVVVVVIVAVSIVVTHRRRCGRPLVVFKASQKSCNSNLPHLGLDLNPFSRSKMFRCTSFWVFLLVLVCAMFHHVNIATLCRTYCKEARTNAAGQHGLGNAHA